MTTKRTPMKCPHCGRIYPNLRTALIPRHQLGSEVCPGSGQYPRNAESDKRPLWKDERKDER